MKRLLLTFCLSGATLCSVALANETSPIGNQITEVTEDIAGKASERDVSEVAENLQTQEIVEGKINAYEAFIRQKLRKEGKSETVFLFSGIAEIPVSRNDPRWAAYRVAALNKAVIAAQTEYLQSLNTGVDNNLLSNYLSQAGLPIPTKQDFDTKDNTEKFVAKLVSLLEEKSDAELDQMGLDAKEFKQAPDPIKRDLFKNSTVNQSIRTSYGNLAGMMVIKVFEEIKQSSGLGSLGVVMALSAQKREQIRALIGSGGATLPIKEKANPNFKSILDHLNKQKESLYLKAGSQVVYDNQGYPMVISYGQAGVTQTSSSQKRALLRQDAQIFATNNAWANFAQAYNLSGDSRFSTSTESIVSETEQFDLIAEQVRAKTSGITNSLITNVNNSTQLNASLRAMTGVKVEYKWRKKHPITGQEMVGSVLVWYPKSIQSAKALASDKAFAADSNSDIKTDEKVISAGSEDMFNSADF